MRSARFLSRRAVEGGGGRTRSRQPLHIRLAARDRDTGHGENKDRRGARLVWRGLVVCIMYVCVWCASASQRQLNERTREVCARQSTLIASSCCLFLFME